MSHITLRKWIKRNTDGIIYNRRLRKCGRALPLPRYMVAAVAVVAAAHILPLRPLPLRTHLLPRLHRRKTRSMDSEPFSFCCDQIFAFFLFAIHILKTRYRYEMFLPCFTLV